MTNVKRYTDKQLLNRVEHIGGKIPNQGKYLIIGVQSQEDEYNRFDDKFYVFDGNRFRQVSTGTTNSGRTALQFFRDYNLIGAAVWKTDEFYEDLYSRGYHRPSRKGGGMRALRQRKPVKFYRDSDQDTFAEEQGKLYEGIQYFNMHGVDYNPYRNITRNVINSWSFGCQVWNRMGDYKQMINATWKRNKPVDYALLKEF